MWQPLLFLLVGGLQYVLDAALFAVFISLGIATLPANVLSRATAAAGGFIANRYITFSQRADTINRFGFSLLRFVILWLVMTALSTGLILLIKQLWGTAVEIQVMGKLLVEAVLAVASFLASKYWVFRD
ncbi:MAG TPA: GtrA family protein [Xanthomonadales bacterium]|nr:GtrA family protein [Xanthomonadales bacterium]